MKKFEAFYENEEAVYILSGLASMLTTMPDTQIQSLIEKGKKYIKEEKGRIYNAKQQPIDSEKDVR